MIAKRFEPFWVTTKMTDMTPEEWESLCDGCGKCCLNKLEDEDNGAIYYTNLACEQLDITGCRCKVYATRQAKVAACITLTPETLAQITWLPDTCSYRLLAETGTLPNWHPLIVGNAKVMQQRGLTVSEYAVPQQTVPEEDWDLHVIKWVQGLPETYRHDEL